MRRIDEDKKEEVYVRRTSVVHQTHLCLSLSLHCCKIIRITMREVFALDGEVEAYLRGVTCGMVLMVMVGAVIWID